MHFISESRVYIQGMTSAMTSDCIIMSRLMAFLVEYLPISLRVTLYAISGILKYISNKHRLRVSVSIKVYNITHAIIILL